MKKEMRVHAASFRGGSRERLRVERAVEAAGRAARPGALWLGCAAGRWEEGVVAWRACVPAPPSPLV